MRKYILLIAAVLSGVFAQAQGPANRTATTVVADVLAQMPAVSTRNYNTQMKELANGGEEVVMTLVNMMKAPGKGSNANVEYALSGLANFVSAPGNESQRAVVLNALKKAVAQVSQDEIKVFLNALIRTVSPADASEQFQPIAQLSLKEAQAALKNAQKAGKTHLRIAAIQQVLGALPQNAAQKTVLSALKDKNKEYRNAALQAAAGLADQSLYNELAKVLVKASPDLKSDILYFMALQAVKPGQSDLIKKAEIRWDQPLMQELHKLLQGSNQEVLSADVKLLTRLADASSIAPIAQLLNSSDKSVVALAQQALASFNGKINGEVAKIIAGASDAGKIAGIQLLSDRKSAVNLGTVLALTDASNADVKAAAYDALKNLATPQDFTKMCGLLEEANGAAIAPLQEAVVAILAPQSKADQVRIITQRMMQAGTGKGHLYFPVLAATGDSKALQTIVEALKSTNQPTSAAAFDALLSWKGMDAAEHLYNICQTAQGDMFNRALDRYIALASDASLTGENQLIMLRKAMEIAKTNEQKNLILKKVDATGTFLAMLYAGQFINVPALQQNAASTVLNIAVAHKEYNGANTRALLNKVIEVLNITDADYLKQSARNYLNETDANEAGFVSIFNGKDLSGWKGLVKDPIQRQKMKAAQLAKEQINADKQMREDWIVEDECLAYVGTGFDNLCTQKQYGDFEMYVDWKLDPNGKEPDAGIYLRGAPQVQIWDTARVDVGAQVGSGGLYNNKINRSTPLKVADNKLGEWNSFYIKMVGDRVTVRLNGELVVDDVILENYWDRKQPIFPVEQLELQAHGSKVWFRNIYVKELKRQEPFQLSEQEKKEGFKVLFDGTNMHQWTGNTVDYTIEDGCIAMNPSKAFGGNLYTVGEYSNFVYRFDFQLTPGANNGIGIRTPMEGDAAYVGMEIQVLDCEHPIYSNITPLQHHGSVYGIIPAMPDHHSAFKPAGEWNTEEIYADGDHIKVTVNGQVILDGNIREATKNGTADHKEHPGLFNKSGHIGFLGHGSPVKFRNIRIKELK